MVVVLAGTRMSPLPARDSVPGPVSPLHLVLCPQEVDHTVQDLCLLHLWILQILDKREKQCTDHSPSQQPGVRNVSRIQTKTGAWRRSLPHCRCSPASGVVKSPDSGWSSPFCVSPSQVWRTVGRRVKKDHDYNPEQHFHSPLSLLFSPICIRQQLTLLMERGRGDSGDKAFMSGRLTRVCSSLLWDQNQNGTCAFSLQLVDIPACSPAPSGHAPRSFKQHAALTPGSVQ